MSLVDERDALQLRHGTTVDNGYVDLLSTTRFGSGRLRYRRRRVTDTLRRLPETSFYTLHENGHVVGGYALTPVPIMFGDRALHALYRHSLVVGENHQGRGLGRWLVDTALGDMAKRSSVDVSFGSIEAGNRRSASIVTGDSSQMLCTLRSELLYRQWTRRSHRVSLNPDEALVRTSLDLGESDCLYRFAHRRNAPYYAVVENDRILAGAGARMNSIDLLPDGMSGGRLYSLLVSLLPPARRRFDPADFRFVSLSDVVIADDGARAWNALVSHVLYEFGAHMAGITLDPQRATYRSLQQQGLLGRFSRATREELTVVARSHAMQGLETPNQPVGLAPLDL